MSHNNESDILRHGEINLRLKESEINFRTISDQSLMGIAIIQDDVFKYVNQKLADLLEYSVEEILNWGPNEGYKIIGSESIELAKEQSPIKQRDLPGAIEYNVIQFKKKSGKFFWAENFSKTVMYQGRTANFVTIIDVTRRVEAEQKLKESEKEFNVLFNNSTSGIAYHKIVYDSDGNPVDYVVTDVNPQFEKILPFKREDVINKISTEAYKVEQAPYLDIYSEVAKTQKSTSFETYFPPIDRHFKISVISSRKGKFITVFDDISEQKKAEQKLRESEEEYRNLYEEAPNAYFSIAPDKSIIRCNKAAENLLGYSRKEMLEMKVFDLYANTEDGLEKAKQKFKQFLAGKQIQNQELQMKNKNGEIVWISLSVKSLYDDGGNVIESRSMVSDISEHKRGEIALHQSEVKYREAYNRANFYKDLFAHDINNIMQVINSSAELISYHLDETEKSKSIQMIATVIKKQITRAKKLVQNVNILSDLESSQQPIKSTEVCELLRNSINFIYNSFPERKINLQIESLKKRIFVQANELLQDVFENILTNAVKYNDKHTVELEIKISKAHKEGKNYIKIEFRDNGIGVADDRKAIIFEKGHRKLKGLKGMGLGLSLVKKILILYDSKIWIEDRVRGDHNQGSNFILLIPQY